MEIKDVSTKIFEKLEKLLENTTDEIGKASSLRDIVDIRIKTLGKKGELTAIIRIMGSLPANERVKAAQSTNAITKIIDDAERLWKETETMNKSEYDQIIGMLTACSETTNNKLIQILDVLTKGCETSGDVYTKINKLRSSVRWEYNPTHEFYEYVEKLATLFDEKVAARKLTNCQEND